MSPQKTKATKKAARTARLAHAALCRLCDPKKLKFKTTDELPDLQFVIGQPRAIRALELGSEVSGQGYNTFILGLPGSGRTTLSREYLERKAKGEPVPDDWCYVNNFQDSRCPQVLRLPPGRALEFRKDVVELIHRCEKGISQQFESKEYVDERDRLVSELNKKQEAEFLRLQEYVAKYSFLIARTPFGFILAPAVEGKPLKPEDIESLSPEQRAKFKQIQEKLGEEVEKSLKRLRDLEKSTSEQLVELNRRTVLFLLAPLMQALKAKYAGLDEPFNHLSAIQNDIIANADQFRADETASPADLTAQIARRDWARRYEVNVLVDNSNLEGAPVIVESHPSYTNLLGRIEHEVVLGATRTDFTLIHPGALHRANGGYLVIPARDLLINAYAWEGLKRVLRDGEIRIVELGQQLGLLSSITLEPRPIPLNLKVILVGTPLLYYLLRSYDEDFAKLFKVRAEFATSMERTPDTEREYGLFVKSVVDDHQLPAFDRTAVAKIIEYSSRLAEDQEKLSTRFGIIADLVREAAYWHRRDNAHTLTEDDRGKVLPVNAESVQKAIDEMIYRSNLIEERLLEMVAKGTLMIDVSGETVGQVNALSVVLMGDYTFGRPNRITATAFAGNNTLVDIERQAELGGPIHTKGVLILSGLLGSRYGREQSLGLSASLTFEQSYEGVEGDSASAAELYALLSAIAEIPIRQDRAITGSINQHGMIQAVGGINEKIEGFFTACNMQGLTGEQGVIIPARNQKNLMLKREVVEAVKEGQFHIWPISTFDEGTVLLTEYQPGELQPDGTYPPGSFNRAVVDHLEDFAKVGKRKPSKNHEEDKEPAQDQADNQANTKNRSA